MTAQPDIKWGISTLGCHELDLPSICKLAKQHGIHHLEIRSLADSLNLPEYLDETYPDDPAAVKQILDQHSQSIIALNSGFSLIEGDENAREEMLAFARWAEPLNVPFIRAFGGGSMERPLTENDLASAAENLKWWKAQREENGWTTQIALETHGGFSSGERCLRLQEAFGHPLDIIWDTHHTWKLGNESATQTWNQIASMIQHIHIKDSVSVPSARHPYSYCLLGEGEFPANDVFNILRDNNYDGVVSLEWERKWHPYLADLDTALVSLKTSGWQSFSSTPSRV
jgi:sugar phosphate isomerase/epimerase